MDLVYRRLRRAAPGGGPVLPRLTSSNGSSCCNSAARPSRRSSSCRAAARPTSTIGVRMLVSPGVCVAPRSVLSTPVIDTSSGMPHAGFAACEHRADGEHVVRRDHRRRRGRARAATRASPPFPIRVRSDRSERRRRRSVSPAAASAARTPAPRSRERSLPAVGALISAKRRWPSSSRCCVIAYVAARLSKPMLGCSARCVDAPRQHVRPAVALEQRIERPVVIEPDERERVDAVLDHLLRHANLGRKVVVMCGKHDGEAARVGLALQRARRARVQRIVERRHDGADHVAALAAQRARRAVRHVAQLVDRRLHAQQRRGIDGAGKFSARETVAVETPARRATSRALDRSAPITSALSGCSSRPITVACCLPIVAAYGSTPATSIARRGIDFKADAACRGIFYSPGETVCRVDTACVHSPSYVIEYIEQRRGRKA